MFVQESNDCVANGSVSGYRQVCGSETSHIDAKIKKYYLVIESAKEEDFTAWACASDNGTGIHYYLNKTKSVHLHAGHTRNLRLGQELKLNCTVTGLSKQIDEVVFIRSDSKENVTIGRIKTSCANESVEQGYHLHCNHTSKDIDTEDYLLITSMRKDDFAQWWCRTQPKGLTSSAVTLTQVDLYLEISANVTHVQINESVKLTCKVSPADFIDNDIAFVKLNGTASRINASFIHQKGNQCKITSQNPGFRSVCGKNTDISESVEKFYELVIDRMSEMDFTKWWCEPFIDGQNYTTVMLEEISKYFHSVCNSHSL